MNQHEDSYPFAYRECAQTLYDALVDDEFYVTMERSVGEAAERREALLRYLDYSMREAERYGILRFAEQQRHGVAVWSIPLAPGLAREQKRNKAEFLRRHMGAASAATYNDIVDFMSRQSNALVDSTAWYLSIVGISPVSQNRGLGRALLGATLQQADRAGVPSFLETFTPRNEAFYERLGYRVAGSFCEPTIGANYSVMVRAPGGA